MKVCNECKEPKFNFQMEKISYPSWTEFSFVRTLPICRSCFGQKVFELKRDIANNKKR